MPRWLGLLFVGVLTGGVTGFVSADEPDSLPPVLALEKIMRQAIARAEPAIACILVSRSEMYGKLGQARSPEDTTGHLGPYDPVPLENLPLTREEKDSWKKRVDLGDPGVVPESFGSGVVVDPLGLILTNYHVVRDAVKIFVRLPGNKGSYADIHAADPRSDLAILRVLNSKVLPLTPIPLGDGSKLQRGQFVLSLANPFAAGFRDGQPSASWGILSNIRRRAPGLPREEERTKSLHHYGTLLQTDARLNLGCSGGALLNLQGELVGLTTALAAIHGGETPGGFAIPMDNGMRRILEVLLRGEEVDYGFLGVGVGTPDNGPGVLLGPVTRGSPAEIEGKLRPNDRILAINDVPLQETDDLFLELGTQLAGSKVRLQIRRAQGTTQNVEVTLAKFYVPGKKIASSPGNRPLVRGLRVDYSSLLFLQQLSRLRDIPAGVLVTEVQAGSPAARANLRTGEIISHVNGRPVANPPAFYQMVATIKGPLELTLAGASFHDPPARLVIR